MRNVPFLIYLIRFFVGSFKDRFDMNSHKLLILCLVLGLGACENKPLPTTLSDRQLSELMAELWLCEGATVMINGYKRDSIAAVYYQEVFAKQRTSKQEYEDNLRLLVSDLGRLEQVMAEAERKLKEKQEGQKSVQ